ncbi:uncharacterized protein LOC144495692 isoform X1 [Mustelus asterias]
MQLFSKSPILEINSLLSAILRPLEQHCVEPLGQAKTHGRLAQREQVSVSRSEHQARSAQSDIMNVSNILISNDIKKIAADSVSSPRWITILILTKDASFT